jgi:hypothetical protein
MSTYILDFEGSSPTLLVTMHHSCCYITDYKLHKVLFHLVFFIAIGSAKSLYGDEIYNTLEKNMKAILIVIWKL